ncbi:MAG: ATP-binding cassette domain-containing protein [Candidatus Adiutrix sp.]|jgi:iron(III) transport system ATP-binding protein|nr:ATP-binding cassette domain-containing protein [Candidatus Adiutrix sp.]
MMFLEISSLSFSYGGPQDPLILDNFDLSLDRGELVGLAGPSGQGKSTLLRLIAGFEKPLRGRISIDGLLVAEAESRLSRPPEKRAVGMVFQDYGLFPHMSVARNIAYGLHAFEKNDRQKRLQEMLDLVRLHDLSHRLPAELSGGQQQRVALARALAPAPKLLLLDEPMSNLDAGLKGELRSELREIILITRTTALFVSHDLDDLVAVCGRIISL